MCRSELTSIVEKASVSKLERVWDASKRREQFQQDQELRQVGWILPLQSHMAPMACPWHARRC